MEASGSQYKGRGGPDDPSTPTKTGSDAPLLEDYSDLGLPPHVLQCIQMYHAKEEKRVNVERVAEEQRILAQFDADWLSCAT